MRTEDYIKSIPNRKADRKIFRGVLYFNGRMSASTGPFYASIKYKYGKPSEGKIYSTDGNRIDVDIREIAELDYKVKQYISNKRSFTIGADELKHALKKVKGECVQIGEYYFSTIMLKKLLEASQVLDIETYNLSSYKDVPCLVGISLIEQNIAMAASLAKNETYKDSETWENLIS